jgi:hypothetical protein
MYNIDKLYSKIKVYFDFFLFSILIENLSFCKEISIIIELLIRHYVKF